MPVPPELMAILQCPVCHSRVEESGERIVCTGCGRIYPVRDGIPHMIVEEAEPPPPKEGQ